MENNSYITVLNTPNYLEGVLTLVESLKRTKSKYPFSIVITENISLEIEKLLRNCDINVIRKNRIDIPQSIKNKNEKGMFPHWINTFDKFLVFELTNFNKLVYLDSDMLIRKSIDELFEKGDMSAVIDRKNGPIISSDWIKLTSGLMVIKPKKGLISEFTKIMYKIDQMRECIGDQDILQEYDCEWEKKAELHLDVKYNMFFPHIDYYINYCNYKFDDISVVHFIYSKKPFFYNKSEISKYIDFIESRKKFTYESNKIKEIEKFVLCGNDNEKKILREYFDILQYIREMNKERKERKRICI